MQVRERMDALAWLVQATVDTHTMREQLDTRQDDVLNIKKRLAEEARVGAVPWGPFCRCG